MFSSLSWIHHLKNFKRKCHLCVCVVSLLLQARNAEKAMWVPTVYFLSHGESLRLPAQACWSHLTHLSMALCCFYWLIYWLSTDLRLKWPKPQSRDVCWKSSWISSLSSGGWTGVISLRSPDLLSVFQDGPGPVQTGPAGGRQGQGGFWALSACLSACLTICL